MKKAKIRNALIEDASYLAELSKQLGYPVSTHRSAQRLQSLLNSDEHSILVACNPDRSVVGWIHVFITMRVESDPFAEIGGFVVGDMYRGSGIGKELLISAERWAIHKKVTKLRIRSRTIRNESHLVFHHLGFAKTKDQYVFDKDLKQTKR
jgi:N-acetylglutamate synthase-like GNAT family acetyltransferase